MKECIILICLLTLIGCSKDDDSENQTASTLLLSEVTSNGTIRTKFFYNQDIISRREDYQNGKLATRNYYQYFADTIIDSRYDAKEQLDRRYKYYHLSQNVLKREIFGSLEPKLGYQHYFYSDDQSCGYNKLQSFNSSSTLLSMRYIYYDEFCNRTDSIFDGDKVFVESIAYEYDGKNSAAESTQTRFFKNHENGNITSCRVFNSKGEIDHYYSYDSQYEYNSDDYPTKETRIFLDGEVFQLTYTYIQY